MAKGDGWWVRAWEKERAGWQGRTWVWKLYLALFVSSALQGSAAAARGSEWLAWPFAVVAVVFAVVTVVAYQASRPPDSPPESSGASGIP